MAWTLCRNFEWCHPSHCRPTIGECSQRRCVRRVRTRCVQTPAACSMAPRPASAAQRHGSRDFEDMRALSRAGRPTTLLPQPAAPTGASPRAQCGTSSAAAALGTARYEAVGRPASPPRARSPGRLGSASSLQSSGSPAAPRTAVARPATASSTGARTFGRPETAGAVRGHSATAGTAASKTPLYEFRTSDLYRCCLHRRRRTRSTARLVCSRRPPTLRRATPPGST